MSTTISHEVFTPQSRRARGTKRRDRSPLATFLVYAVLLVAVVLVLFPLLWIVLTSIKSNVQASTYPPQFVGFHPTGGNYSNVTTAPAFRRDLVTSVVVTAVSTVIAVAAAALAAYAMVRLQTPFRRLLVALIVLLQVVPGIVLVIPLFKLTTTLGLYDSWLSLIVIYAALDVPFATWILVAFVRSLPIDLEEAAMVDGATRLQVVRKIVLPILAPGLATAAIFSGIASWNQFLIPLILAQSRAQPLTVYVTNFATSRGTNFGALSASAVVIMAPVVVFVITQQRHLVRGLLMGSMR